MQKMKRRGMMSIISPFIIYYIVTMAVEILALSVMVYMKMPDIIKKQPADPEMISTYIMEEYMPFFVEEFLKNILLITVIVALCAIPIFLVMFRKDKKYEAAMGVPEVEKAPLGKYVFIVLIAVAASLGMNNILILSNISTYSQEYQETANLIYQSKLALQIVGTGFIIPVMEELMFRGLVFRRMNFMVGRKAAMIYSALIFGVYHGNLVQGIYGFVLGFLCAYVYDKYGSLKAPILFHMVANLVSVFATEIHLFEWIFQNPVRMGIVTVICAAVASSLFVGMQQLFNKK